MNPIIKEQNYYCIKDFAMSKDCPEMQGTKLNALFRLIEKKGEPIQTDDKKLQGVMALQIAPSEWIAIKRTAFGKPAGELNGQPFYPCMLETYLLQSLYEHS